MKFPLLALGFFASLTVAFANEEHVRQLTQSEAVSPEQESYDDSLADLSSRTLKI